MKTNTTTAKNLERMAQIMREVGNEFGDHRVELHQVELFCELAAAALRDDPRDSRELAEKLGVAKSTVSRNVAWLSERGRMEKKGLRLVRASLDANDYRRKPLSLTAKGKTWAQHLADLLKETA